MSRFPISMNRPNCARQERPMGIASAASEFKTTSTPFPPVSSMTASAKSARRESMTCLTPRTSSRARLAKHSEAKHPVSRCHMGDSPSNGLHYASHFVAEHPGIRGFCGIKGERLEYITKIHASGFHFDHHLTRTARRQSERHQAQRAEKSALTGFKSNRQRAIEHLLSWRQTATKAPDIAS